MLTRREWMTSTALFGLAATGSASLPRTGQSDEQETGHSASSGSESGPPSRNPIDIGSRRELFVDDLLIDRLNGAELRLHPPQPRAIVLQFDQPWEGLYCGYETVLKDGDVFRF